jgi:hypothetical protein
MPFDIRLDATYQTSAGAPRSLFETRQAHPDAAVSFAYDDRSTGANFEQRPGGACPAFGLTNTWFNLSLRGNASISSCRFQDSWDPTELPCPTSAIDAFNQGREIIINTDSFAINPSTCAPFQFPSVTHVPVGTPVFMRILFDVGGMTYVRGVNFIKHP